MQSPRNLVFLNIDLFDNFGALIVAVIASLVYGRRWRLSFWNTLNSLTLLISLLALGFGLSHLATGAAFGQETDLPWAIYLWGTMRHPTQYYDIGTSIPTLGLIWIRKPNSKHGSEFLAFVALISGSRLIVESFRGDSTLVLGYCALRKSLPG